MEIIRKKICLDKLISHRNGISSYIPKDDENNAINYVISTSSKSNYGMFPCDFVLIQRIKNQDTQTQIDTVKYTELSRLKYLDALRWYNSTIGIIEQGSILKRISYNYEDITHTDCVSPEEPLENCGVSVSAETDYDLIQTSLFVTDDSEEKSMFDCILVDSSLLKEYSNGKYIYNEENTIRYKNITENSLIDLDELPEEEKIFIAKMEKFIFGPNGDVDDVSTYDGDLFTMTENDRIFITENYDDYLKKENKWNEWWQNGYNKIFNVDNTNNNNSSIDSYSNQPWEKEVFDENYILPTSLRFIYDFEKYILGKIRVPEIYNGERITGSKVPNSVFYLNYKDYLLWFDENEEYLDSNEDIKKEWDKRGGKIFKYFLMNITPVLFDGNLMINNNNKLLKYFDFAVPNIEIDLAIENEFINEYSYAVYEYSVGVDGELIDATMEYEKGDDDKIESALTPAFYSFSANPIEVESKLDTLIKRRDIYYFDDNLYGAMPYFNGNTPQESLGKRLFKCKFYSGQCSEPEIIGYTRTKIDFYVQNSEEEWYLDRTYNVGPNILYDTPEEKPKTHSGCYQVVGIKEASSASTIDTGDTQQINGHSDDGKIRTISSTTYYTQTITRTYEWCECIEVTGNASNIICGDGEEYDFSDMSNPKYRNILILPCVPNAVEDAAPGKEYYYMVKYNNGFTNIGSGVPIDKQIHPKTLDNLPFEVGKKVNIETYTDGNTEVVKYDMVSACTVSDEDGDNKGTAMIEYIIGATEGEDIETSGIHYVDTYYYESNFFVNAVIDGYYNADILCKQYSLTKETAHSDDYNADREYIPSKIIGMEVGTQWTPESSLRAYLYTDDSYDNLIEYPNIDVDIVFDRGNAAAWEKHFKLSECNTFDDLKNYSNGFFNI